MAGSGVLVYKVYALENSACMRVVDVSMPQKGAVG